MSKILYDINEDEIRVIRPESKILESLANKSCTLPDNQHLSSDKPMSQAKPMLQAVHEVEEAIPRHNNMPRRENRSGRGRLKAVISVVIAVLVLAGLIYAGMSYNDTVENTDNTGLLPSDESAAIIENTVEDVGPKGYVDITDTVIDKAPLTILRPINMTPTLHVGTEIFSDTTAMLVVQAADLRKDNGEILGAYVKEGELLGKGQSKSGFCAIIGGKLTIGVADATPYLEQALETGGYFFRQYPLVVGNQIVENKPKGAAMRKALAELNGQPVIVLSGAKMTFHDFSQSLIGLGVSNAIYMVGSTAYGFVVDKEGRKEEFGDFGCISTVDKPDNLNYLVWR